MYDQCIIFDVFIHMKLDSIRIVLVETSHPGNIGSTARAMKTMGLKHLYLVSPNLEPYRQAHEMAAGADDLIEQAVKTNTLAEAITGCHLVFATSARPRDIALPGLLPSACAELVGQQSDDTQIALIFGREHAGLTNDELLQSHYHVNIPSNPDFSSLNLSQAVQILAYEMRMRLLSPQACVETGQDAPATIDAIEQFYTHLREVLIAIEFLKPSNPRRALQRLRRLFNRARLESMELNILRGILSQVQYALGKKQDD